jgi:putative component of membrane protein insertase Oxa1/YidC/SpoIIIJ protein YidD
MQIYSADIFSRKLSVVIINGYQKYISPHKGFACPHRVLYGTESCSQYIKRVIDQEGLKAALKKSRLRFHLCKKANQILRYRNQELDCVKVNSSENGEGKSENKKQQQRKIQLNESSFRKSCIACGGCLADIASCSMLM